jgi:hypothetical protein
MTTNYAVVVGPANAILHDRLQIHIDLALENCIEHLAGSNSDGLNSCMLRRNVDDGQAKAKATNSRLNYSPSLKVSATTTMPLWTLANPSRA